MRRQTARALLLFASLLAVAAVAEGWLRSREPEEMVVVADLKYARPEGWPGSGWVEGRSPTERTGPRVVCVGDSLTEGLGVAPRDPWPWQLRQGLEARHVEVLNFGIAGWDAAQVAALLETRVEAWKPDVVVWGTYPNDIFQTLTIYGRDPSLPIFVDPEVPERLRILPPALARWLVPRSALFRLVQGRRYTSVATEGMFGGGEWYGEQVRRVVAWQARSGIPVVVLAIPSHVLADGCAGADAATCEQLEAWYGIVTATLSESGLPWVDGLSAWSGRGPFFQPGSRDVDHPDAAAHRLLAEAVRPAVEERLPAPEPPSRRRSPRRAGEASSR